jgi:anti-sigma factor RsiW
VVEGTMTCAHCEELLSDYLEGVLDASARERIGLHLRSCPECALVAAGMREVIGVGKHLTDYAPPQWLAARILAATPRVVRETWRDTLASLARWIAEPRVALMILTASLVLGWMGSLAGVSPSGVGRAVQDPTILYYEAGTRLNRAYGNAVRTYYSMPLVTQIQSQIDRIRESS